MKKQQGFGLVQILLLIVLVGMIGATGYYVWHGQRVQSVQTFETCVSVGGETDSSDLPGVHATCTIYGNTYLEDGYLAWDIGQRFNELTHSDALEPAIVENTVAAPGDLVSMLEYDNGGCDVDGWKSSKAAFEIISVVNDSLAKLKYGCEADMPLSAFMLVIKQDGQWKQISPTNQFTEEGVPSCAMVNTFKITSKLEPECFKVADEKYVISKNQNE